MPVHPLYADPAARAALLRLLATAWPRLPERVETAVRLGWRWDDAAVDEPSLVVACEVADGVLRVHDVVAGEVARLDEVLAAAPAPHSAVELWMPADRLAPDAEPLPSADEDLLMVRGDWPALPPFHVGRFASH